MIQALRDNVIVKPLFEETKSAIIIPKDAKKYRQYDGQVIGEIVSVGKDYKYPLKAGDKISFVRHEGVKFQYEGQVYLKLKSCWVMGVVS